MSRNVAVSLEEGDKGVESEIITLPRIQQTESPTYQTGEPRGLDEDTDDIFNSILWEAVEKQDIPKITNTTNYFQDSISNADGDYWGAQTLEMDEFLPNVENRLPSPTVSSPKAITAVVEEPEFDSSSPQEGLSSSRDLIIPPRRAQYTMPWNMMGSPVGMDPYYYDRPFLNSPIKRPLELPAPNDTEEDGRETKRRRTDDHNYEDPVKAVEQRARREGRDPSSEELKEARKQRRLLRNRLSARSSREKRKDFVMGLEGKVRSLTDLKMKLEAERKILMEQLALARREIMYLRREIANSTTNVVSK